MNARGIRELDHREGDGIEVSLLWRQVDNRVYIAVVDHRHQEQFTQQVDPAAARDAFHHPYAYRTLAGGDNTVDGAAGKRIRHTRSQANAPIDRGHGGTR